MDIITVTGLVIAWGSVIISAIFEHNHIGNWGSYLKLGPLVLVLGGSLGATMIAFTKEEMMSMLSVTKQALFNKEREYTEIIKMIVEYSKQVRRDGLLVLEKQTKNIKDPFMKKGVQLLVDGVDMNHIRIIMETDIAFLKQRHKESADFFGKLGGFAPTLGIIGTVMGLISMLANLSDPGSMGPAIAAAFIATLYGVSSANLIFLPIGNKLKNISGKEVLERRIILEGLLAMQAGDNPRIIEERLLSFIPPKKREEGRAKKAGAGSGSAAAAAAGK